MAARALFNAAKEETEPWHLDHWLKDQLFRGEVSQVGCSYVYPSIGDCVGHLSGCDGNETFFRESSWDSPWVASGTRQKQVSIHPFDLQQKKQPAVATVEIHSDLISPDGLWYTLAPSNDEEEQALAASSTRQEGDFVPGLLTATSAAVPKPKSKRAKRQLRSATARQTHRHFTTDAAQAACMFAHPVLMCLMARCKAHPSLSCRTLHQADAFVHATNVTGKSSYDDLPPNLRYASRFRQPVDQDALDAWGMEHWKRLEG